MAYKWLAIYKGGSTLEQYNEHRTPKEVCTEDIDRANLERFILFDDISGKIVIELFLEDGQRLIYRRRVAFNETSDKPLRVIHLVGWQQTVNGTNVQSVAYCFESGEVALGGRFKEGHPISNPIVFTDKEKAQGLTP